MRYYAVTFTTRVCVCEPADQLYQKDARYRGYLTWYIFRRHVYLPYLKHREPQSIERREETFQQNCLLCILLVLEKLPCPFDG